MISFRSRLRIHRNTSFVTAKLSQSIFTLSRQQIPLCPTAFSTPKYNGHTALCTYFRKPKTSADVYGISRISSGPNVSVILGVSLARFFPVYGWKILTFLIVGASSTFYWILYRVVGLSKEEEEKLKNFVISKDKKIVALSLNQQTKEPDVTEVAELHMHRLLKLFLNLASQSRDGIVITKDSWERANSSLPAEERAIATLLFHGGSLDNSAALTFEEFAKLAVLKSAADQGDADSQVELLFELIDSDGRGSITLDQCSRFVATCMRAGKLPPGDGGPHAAAHLTARLFTADGGIKDRPVTRDDFRRTIGPALYRDVWPAGPPAPAPASGAGAGVLAGSGPDFSALLTEYRALRARRTPLHRAPPFPPVNGPMAPPPARPRFN